LTAPATEFARLAPVLGGLLGDLREQIHTWDVAGRTLDKPLLIVIDEAGQLELGWLPEEVSTIAGLGAMLVTGWQSRAQINHRYGSLADAVLGGHRSKVFFNGTDDPSTLEYVARVTGTEHVAQRGWSAETSSGRKTVSEHTQREDLVPAHVIRQMSRQEAVLLHGTLPPIHLRMVRWWEDTALRALIPTGPDGQPASPPTTGTCPVEEGRSTAVSPILDEAMLAESLHQLPRARTAANSSAPGTATKSRTTGRVALVGQAQLDLTLANNPAASADKPPQDAGESGVRRNRVAGTCERCGAPVAIGAGALTRFGDRDLLYCHPRCPDSNRE
jgi:type IV secretion system protein VirD4